MDMNYRCGVLARKKRAEVLEKGICIMFVSEETGDMTKGLGIIEEKQLMESIGKL